MRASCSCAFACSWLPSVGLVFVFSLLGCAGSGCCSFGGGLLFSPTGLLLSAGLFVGLLLSFACGLLVSPGFRLFASVVGGLLLSAVGGLLVSPAGLFGSFAGGLFGSFVGGLLFSLAGGLFSL